MNKMEKAQYAQYDAALVISGVIRRTSQKKLCADLGLESLKVGPWFKKFACVYKIQCAELPMYLLPLIPAYNNSYIFRKHLRIPHYYFRTNTIRKSFFSNVLSKWNKLDEKIRSATSFSMFKDSLLKTCQSHTNSTYRIHNQIEIRLLTCLSLSLSYLNEHKFIHNFADCVNPLGSCSIKCQTTLHFFVHCWNFFNFRRKLFDKIKLLDETLLQLNEESLLAVLLFDSKIYNEQVNVEIQQASVFFFFVFNLVTTK